MKLFTFIAALFLTVSASAQSSWSLSTTGLPGNCQIRDLALAPNGDVYLTGWQYGTTPFFTFANLYRSTNQGASWTNVPLGSSMPLDYPNTIVFAGNKLFMAGVNGSANELYVSTDLGQNWTLSGSGINSAYKLNDLTVESNGDIYLGCSLPAGSIAVPRVVRSINGGTNWNDISVTGVYPSQSVSDLEFDNAGKMYLSGSNNQMTNLIYATANHGLNWSSANTGIPLSYYVDAFAPGNGQDMYAACSEDNSSSYIPRIMKTTNGGSTWGLVSSTGLTGMQICISLLNTGDYLLLAGTAGGSSGPYYVFRSPLPRLATISTAPAMNIGDVAAVTGGNVTHNGNTSFVSRGVCWATTSNPTTSSQTLSAGSGMGIYTVTLNGLQPSTTYYVRAYATNSVGTNYGNEISFTTSVATGLSSYNPNAVLNVHPVPASDFIYLPVSTGNVNYTIYDLTGKVMLDATLEEGKNKIDISNLPKGCYFLQSQDGQRKKILKQ